MHRVNCADFSGSGFFLQGRNDPSSGYPGSTDLMRVDECNAWSNQQNGFYCTGQDANVITFIKCSAGTNGWYGFFDGSFLGCNFFSCHSASNGTGGGRTTGVDACICYYNGVTYCVVRDMSRTPIRSPAPSCRERTTRSGTRLRRRPSPTIGSAARRIAPGAPTARRHRRCG